MSYLKFSLLALAGATTAASILVARAETRKSRERDELRQHECSAEIVARGRVRADLAAASDAAGRPRSVEAARTCADVRDRLDSARRSSRSLPFEGQVRALADDAELSRCEGLVPAARARALTDLAQRIDRTRADIGRIASPESCSESASGS